MSQTRASLKIPIATTVAIFAISYFYYFKLIKISNFNDYT